MTRKVWSAHRPLLWGVLVLLTCWVLWGGVDSALAGRRGGTLRVSMPTDVTQVDLHKTSAQINNVVFGMTVYETLFTYDAKYNYKPFLVESYKFSDGGKIMDLTLKKGVKFHNGQEMTAEDVKFSLDRARSPKLPAFHHKNLAAIKEIKVTGPYDVQIVMTQPIPNILFYLSSSVGTIAIMPKKALEADGNKVVTPIGTGPYKFVSWKKDSKIILERFDDYSSASGPVDGLLGERPRYFDRIEYYVVKEPATRIMALERGDLDFISVLPYQQIDGLKKRKDLKVVTGLSPKAVWYLFFVNFKNPILADVNFRKALAYSLDREEIAKAAVWGYGTPNFSVISPKQPAYSPELEKMAPSYDLAKAKEYLKKSSYKGQKIKILTSKNYVPMYNQALAAQAMWAAAGINTELEVVDWATHLARWKKGDHDILSFAMIGRMDPLAQTWTLDKNNFYGYQSARAHQLRQAMANTLDQEQKQKYFQEIYKLTCNDVPFIINFYIHGTYAFKPYVKGFAEFDIFKTRFWDMYFSK
ncbi:MAG: hypothetical protein K9K65_12510 [Desulfarculaceae bacterium]|nr:hypothetical protein [Desulfarculaceae bacterium]MCF8047748.1 hypothetical protein [Desulfarculaceae bacterium]MCF8065070.1 hypothetical protein [Desulfarculaceae bacterium]MCF8098655.1 hypothetical protein [Desulfarculaceae bacterium]